MKCDLVGTIGGSFLAFARVSEVRQCYWLLERSSNLVILCPSTLRILKGRARIEDPLPFSRRPDFLLVYLFSLFLNRIRLFYLFIFRCFRINISIAFVRLIFFRSPWFRDQSWKVICGFFGDENCSKLLNWSQSKQRLFGEPVFERVI